MSIQWLSDIFALHLSWYILTLKMKRNLLSWGFPLRHSEGLCLTVDILWIHWNPFEIKTMKYLPSSIRCLEPLQRDMLLLRGRFDKDPTLQNLHGTFNTTVHTTQHCTFHFSHFIAQHTAKYAVYVHCREFSIIFHHTAICLSPCSWAEPLKTMQCKSNLFKALFNVVQCSAVFES